MIFNLSGGGAGLNFAIVGGTTAPTNPRENTIWVNTSDDITSWIFDANEPVEPEEGMAWFRTVKRSSVLFNALKKNAIVIYPSNCQQYIAGAWVSKTAKSFIDDKWVEWYRGQVYDNGNEYEDVTGGISVAQQTYSAAEKKDDHILLYATTTDGTINPVYSHATCYLNNPIDLTNYSTITLEANTAHYDSSHAGMVCVGIKDRVYEFTTPTEDNRKACDLSTSDQTGDIVVSHDVSDVSGSYYVGVYNKMNTTKVNVIIIE